MPETTVNQRLKFLIAKLGMSARAFSDVLGESPTNIQNYIGKRNSIPSAEFIERVLSHFENVNPIWLAAGRGEPFIGDAPTTSIDIDAKKNKGHIQSNNSGDNTINHFTLDDCKRELAASRKEAELLREQLTMKDTLLAAKDDIIAAKEEMLFLLRGGYNRPN